ncbi:MAG TPA: transketolase [bacterium]|nr:transketolase [bacterium]HOL47030.1 transketolase [bacterium]HPQ18468.1 transketolase [bacterium]
MTTKNKTVQELYKIANEIRKDVIQMLAIAKSGHPGGSLSAIEILTTLYFSVMTYNPKEPRWENRDRFILSKGHGAPAYYAVLARAGFFEREQLWTLRKINSKLQGHPDMNKTPGVDMTTGSLGQGLSAANGMAMIGKLFKKNYKVYVLLGDGEVEEGEIWEAAMTANHYKLDNLIAIIDYNGLQIDGSVFQVKSTIEPLADKWISFGWYVITVNGHDIEELLLAFKKANEIIDRPKMIIAYTIKGKGISFMERVVDYHGSVLSESECQKALEELKYI